MKTVLIAKNLKKLLELEKTKWIVDQTLISLQLTRLTGSVNSLQCTPRSNSTAFEADKKTLKTIVYLNNIGFTWTANLQCSRKQHPIALERINLMTIWSICSVIITLFNQENKFVLTSALVNLSVSTKIRKQSKKQHYGRNN